MFKNNVRRIISERGASIAEVAENAGMKRTQLSNLLNSNSGLTIETAERIADSLNLDFLEIFHHS